MLRTLCRAGGAVFKSSQRTAPRLWVSPVQQRWASRLPMNTVVLFVPQQEAWVIERMGRFHRILEPGLNFLIPILDRIRYVQSLKEIVIDIPEQSAVSLDNVTLQIDGVLYLRILDPFKASYGVEDPEYAVTQLAQTTMRSELGKLTLDRVFRERESLNLNIVHSINQASDEWGIRCLFLPPRRPSCLSSASSFPAFVSVFPIIYFTVVGNCFALHPSRCQLMELSPPRMDRSVVMVTFINHTSCECLSKRPLHSIIRRAATDHLCSPPDLPCASGSLWDPVNCVCVSADTINYSDRETVALDLGLLALCGPNRVLKDLTCECVCQNGLTEASCDPGWKLDHNTCECQCEGQGDGKLCPAGQRWDDELCGCVCAADCPGNQPLNPDTCLCECRESPQSCLRQGKRFNPNTCSCYRLPCRKPRRVCQTGFYYSHQVCQCIPDYMRPEWN